MFNERIALGLPSLAGYELFDALSKAREFGFQSVMSLPGGPNTKHSLGEFPTLNFYEADEAYKERVKSALCQIKHVSIHQAWDNDWRLWFECANYFGAEIVTVHSGLRTTDQTFGQFCSQRIKYFREIGDYAKVKGVKIGIENEGGDYEDYMQLLEAIDHTSIGATIDVGHCAYFNEIKSITNLDNRIESLNALLHRMVIRLENNLYHFHLHNVRKTDWRDHRSAMDGIIDFSLLFTTLKKIGYSGLFDIELEEPERERKAIETGKYLTELIDIS